MAKKKKKLPFGGKKAAPFVKGGGKAKITPKGGAKTAVAGVKTNANFGQRMAAARKKKRGK